jgi:hypothetical protein
MVAMPQTERERGGAEMNELNSYGIQSDEEEAICVKGTLDPRRIDVTVKSGRKLMVFVLDEYAFCLLRGAMDEVAKEMSIGRN